MNTVVHTYNQSGEKIGDAKLPEEIFGVSISPALLHQVVVSAMSNRRKAIADTRDRSEVRGGGRKPWKQKGTGRARHGSIRSPIWKGGGVTFGPTNERNFQKKINKAMRRKAFLGILSGKARDGEVIVLDALSSASGKTKEIATLIRRVVPGISSVVLIMPKKDEKIERAGRNIVDCRITNVSQLNIMDLMNYKYAVLTQETVKALQEKYQKK